MKMRFPWQLGNMHYAHSLNTFHSMHVQVESVLATLHNACMLDTMLSHTMPTNVMLLSAVNLWAVGQICTRAAYTAHHTSGLPNHMAMWEYIALWGEREQVCVQNVECFHLHAHYCHHNFD